MYSEVFLIMIFYLFMLDCHCQIGGKLFIMHSMFSNKKIAYLVLKGVDLHSMNFLKFA